jgi:hypothetical protein
MDIFPRGFDISKSKFDCALSLDNGKLRHRVVLDSPAGCIPHSAWLSRRLVSRVHACTEATVCGYAPRLARSAPEARAWALRSSGSVKDAATRIAAIARNRFPLPGPFSFHGSNKDSYCCNSTSGTNLLI